MIHNAEQYELVGVGDGNRVTRRQRQAVRAAEKAAAVSPFIYLQGSREARTWYSGTSHTGLGACDLYLPGMGEDKELRTLVTHALRKVGHQAAWLRGPAQKMPWHWHTLDLDTHQMDEHEGYGAVWQVHQYRLGNNGMAEGAPDPNPFRPDPITKWQFN